MNIAILIGVSEYKNGIQNLPGSKNDILQFETLVKSTKKYDEILSISEETESGKLKDKLTSFINEKKGTPIEELLFYFSGHGDFASNEFYYILSDFGFDKRTQTSLQNSELDNLIKSLSPKLVVKVVDACHSGINYIKDVAAIDLYIKSTSNQFQNCYFFYSSLNAQSSYQNNSFSFFTLSFLNAIKQFQQNEIRYKDIIDYISDDFASFPEQTPFFVTQADFTESFCIKTPELNKFLSQIPETFPSSDTGKEEIIKYSTLEELIKSDAVYHLSIEDVHKILLEIRKTVESFTLESDIDNLYQIKLSFPNSTPFNCIAIGQFTAKNKEGYFAKPTYTTETYEDIEKPDQIDIWKGIQTKPYTITKKREVITGYSLSENYPYEHISIDINSNYPNISSYKCTIAFVNSDRKIKLYYFISNYIRENWKNRSLNSRFDWNATEFNLIENNQIIDFIKTINKSINQRIISDIKRQFDSFLKDK
jgi:hypothetical protein